MHTFDIFILETGKSFVIKKSLVKNMDKSQMNCNRDVFEIFGVSYRRPLVVREDDRRKRSRPTLVENRAIAPVCNPH
jgi:hypothetical protein